jgi:DNA-binding NtrC family response regulator
VGEGTILLVDDDPEVRSVTAQLLKMSGYVVVVAASAPDAITCFEDARDEIDILITDLVLAGGPNGIVLASVIRDRRPELPVLLVTGHSDALLEDVRTEGADVLMKPFGHTALLRAIRRVLRPATLDAASLVPGATAK